MAVDFTNKGNLLYNPDEDRLERQSLKAGTETKGWGGAGRIASANTAGTSANNTYVLGDNLANKNTQNPTAASSFANLSTQELEELKGYKQGWANAATDEERGQWNQKANTFRNSRGITADNWTLGDVIREINRRGHSAADDFAGVSTDSIQKLLDTKLAYAAATDDQTRGMLHNQANELRASMGIAGDNYTAEQLQQLINQRNASGYNYLDKMGQLAEEQYENPYLKQVQDSAESVRNFVYNPETDAAYQSYADMYNRAGQSAAKQSLANQAATNMGRVSSYGAAAAAQAQQAYAQKAADMIPQLAEQAYNKLLQNYNISRDLYDTAQNEYNDRFNRYGTLYDLYSGNYDRERDRTYEDWERDNTRWYSSQMQPLEIENARNTNALQNVQIGGGILDNMTASEFLKRYPRQLEQEEILRDHDIRDGNLSYDMTQWQFDQAKKEAAAPAYTAAGNYVPSGSSGGGSSGEASAYSPEAILANAQNPNSIGSDGREYWNIPYYDENENHYDTQPWTADDIIRKLQNGTLQFDDDGLMYYMPSLDK